MTGRLSLRDVVTRARARLLASDPEVALYLEVVLADLEVAATAGFFDHCVRLVELRYADDAALEFLEDRPDETWAELVESVRLAERIDSFLALEGAGDEGRRLALACRADLRGLPVLADWLEENGRPAWAVEARHLAGLVRFL